jgi:hypothetical protein
VFPLDPSIAMTDGTTEREPIWQIEVSQESSAEAQELDPLVGAGLRGSQLERGEESALDFDAEPAKAQK